jgi:phospholipase D1/2
MHAMNLDNGPVTSLLRPGQTCWRTNIATRATLLVDGEQYFSALRTALLQARQQILIAGWDLDSRTVLPRTADEGDVDAPEELGALLGFIRRTRPGVEIHVVRWDYHWFYSDDREADTARRLQELGVAFHHDDCHPVTGCVHHKVVVIDAALAFCGGIDLTHKRWDSCAHDPGDSRRRDPNGKPYIPVHDTQLCVAGPIVRDMADYLHETWPTTAPRPGRIEAESPPWPTGLRVEFRDIRVGVSRTLPASTRHVPVREIEAFYLAAIAHTSSSLYIENQYFTSTRIATAIAEQFKRKSELQGLLVGMDRPKTQAELHTMGYGRSAFCRILAEAGVIARVPVVAAFSANAGINVHSKLAVFDDRWLTVGSANLNRRSMGFDVECNLILEASTLEHREQIRQIRNGLLAEHLGMSTHEVEDALETHGLQNLPDAAQRSRRLVRIDPQQNTAALGPILAPIFDPEAPWPARLAQRKASNASRWSVALLLLAVSLGAAIGGFITGDLPIPSLIQSALASQCKSKYVRSTAGCQRIGRPAVSVESSRPADQRR